MSQDQDQEQGLRILDNALWRIARRGDCEYHDEKERPRPCDCPRCLAIAALEATKNWRFHGALHERTQSAAWPREVKMHAAWMKLASRDRDPDSLLSLILREDSRADRARLVRRDERGPVARHERRHDGARGRGLQVPAARAGSRRRRPVRLATGAGTRGQAVTDPTTAALAAQSADREQLRADGARIERELVDVRAAIATAREERDRLAARGDALFVEGYDQAVREIRDHFKKVNDGYVVAVIEETWLKERS